MIFIAYFCLLVTVILLTRRLDRTFSGLLRLSYNLVFIVIAQVVLSIGAAGGMSFSQVLHLIAESLYVSSMGMTFNGGIDWASALAPGIRAQLWLIMFTASLMTVETVLVTFFGRILVRLRLRLRGLFRDRHFIISGDPQQAEVLAKGIERECRKPHIILIPSCEVAEDSPLHTHCRIEKASFLKRLKQKKQYDIVLLPDQPYDNLSTLYALNERYDDSFRLRVTAFMDNETLRFKDIRVDHLDVCLVSSEQLITEWYLDSRRPVDVASDRGLFSCGEDGVAYLNKPFEICIIGFGSLGQEFLLNSFENAAFLTRDRSSGFSALVLDDALKVNRDSFLNDVPYFRDNPQIQFVDISDGLYDYRSSIGDRIHTLDQIVVASESTERNIRTAIQLSAYMDGIGIFENRPEIVVVLHETVDGAMKLLADYPGITTIDFSHEILNYRTLIERDIDRNARAINEMYNKTSNKNDSWNHLGTFIQDSNRAVEKDVYTKRMLYELCDEKGAPAIEMLAEYEHARWVAFHVAHGWSYLSVDDLTQQELDKGATKRPEQKRHICLIPWDALDALPQKKPGLFKEYDRENVVRALENQ